MSTENMDNKEEKIIAGDPGELPKDDTNSLARIAILKFIFVVIIGLVGISSVGAGIIFFHKKAEESKNKKEEESKSKIHGNYSINIIPDDYGCGVNKAIINFSRALDKVSKETFTVIEIKKGTDEKNAPNEKERELTASRTIIDTYFSDEFGEKVSNSSQYVTIEMNTSPYEGSPLTFSHITGYTTWCEYYRLKITLSPNCTEELKSNGENITSIEIDLDYTKKILPTSQFTKGHTKYEDIDFNYAVYNPPEGSDRLFVWLHGGGEGGFKTEGKRTDIEVTLLSNKVTALTQEKFQSTVGPINVLVPQGPTMWKDDGKGNVLAGNRESIYIKSVIAFIDDFVEKNNIKTVIIGGCSNGGYLTMNIAMDYGNKYQGYVGICESMRDENISDEDIEVLKNVSLYLIFARDDNTAKPDICEYPTMKRLYDANATDFHVSVTDNITDPSGKYFDEEGNPYRYYGHDSWVYFFNDVTECSECGISVFNWIADVIKESEKNDEDKI